MRRAFPMLLPPPMPGAQLLRLPRRSRDEGCRRDSITWRAIEQTAVETVRPSGDSNRGPKVVG